MSGSAKDDARGSEDEAAAREERREPAPVRGPSEKLFDLDEPARSRAHSFELPQLTAADLRPVAPSNDAATAEEPARAGAYEARQLTGDVREDTRLIDAEFAALGSTAELEAPLLAAREAASKKPGAERRFDTQPLTHVPVEADFDATLRLPGPNDSLESRRSRLALRYKSACAAYKVVTGFELGAEDRKELVELFSDYEARLRAALPEGAASLKRDADGLHSLLPVPGLDELERALGRIEDQLLRQDEGIVEREFRARVNKTKQDAKSLLRYARVLASKRFNVGYRRDRFEYLAFELLTTQASDKRLVLLPRDKAATVLQHLLAGLPQSAAPEERAPAVAHMREALDRLAAIDGAEAFFESEFFLDLHGYKISMRDQITCPEFLYLCAALHVELHNRLLAWSRSGKPSWQALQARLYAHQAAAEQVFPGFRRPHANPAAKAPPHSELAKDAAAEPAAPKRRKPKARAAKPKEGIGLANWLKIAGLGVVIALTAGSVLHSAGVFRLSPLPVTLTEAQLESLSPLLTRAVVSADGRSLEGHIRRTDWLRLDKLERRATAQELATKLKGMNIVDARIFAYKTPVIRIEYSTVVSVDESAAPGSYSSSF